MLTKTKIVLSTLIAIGFASTVLATGASAHKARADRPVATSAFASVTIGSAERAWMERASALVGQY